MKASRRFDLGRRQTAADMTVRHELGALKKKEKNNK